jgi:hypothetical protein
MRIGICTQAQRVGWAIDAARAVLYAPRRAGYHKPSRRMAASIVAAIGGT